MLTNLTLHDFKAFSHLDLEFRPLTVLVGENNSGKSSIIAALRLLAQTTLSFDAETPLLLDGPFGDFGTYRDVVHGNYRGRPLKIVLEITDDAEDASSAPDLWQLSLEYKYRPVLRELILREAVLTTGATRKHLITVRYSDDARRQIVTRFGGRSVPIHHRARLSSYLRMFHFLPMLYPRRRVVRGAVPVDPFDGVTTPDRGAEVSNIIEDGNFALREFLRHIDYIGAMRLSPERSYRQTGEVRNRIGANGENWVAALVRDIQLGDKEQMREPLTRWLMAAGLASDVRARWSSDRHYEIQVQHPVTNEFENLADVGQANSQVFPVLIGGLRLRPGSTYLVEEPEIHLHPRAQAELGDFFLELRQRGVNTVVETHSEYLLVRLQQHVANGALTADDIVFYYVAAGTNGKVATQMRLDNDGKFSEPMPSGFFPERMEEARKLARIRGAKLMDSPAS